MKLKILPPFIFSILLILTLFPGCANYAKRKENTCKVHQEKMKKSIVRISYGLAPFPTDEETRFYPHRKQRAKGGCVVGFNSFALVYFCKGCNKAYKQRKNP